MTLRSALVPARSARSGPAASRAMPAAARAVLRLLERLETGHLALRLPDGSTRVCAAAEPGALKAALHVLDWGVFGATLRAGDVGFAEAYVDGRWSTPDLPGLMRLLLANRPALERAVYGSWWGALLDRMRHALRRNSRRGSRRNIAAHYDLGNAFYALWLDPSMTYSSAWFEGEPQRALEEAQHAKLRRAIEATGIAPGGRLLEIGCGWGALAEHAASRHGVEVVGVTLSREQLEFARARLARAGLAERAQLRLQDYRDVADGPFDAVVSIEMFEAVGQAYWPVFFETLHRQLKPGARACIQTIVIREDLFERYARSTDFIQRHVFPGGMLPSAARFEAQARRAGLAVGERLDFGPDYGRTLQAWRTRFLGRLPEVKAQGFDDRFVRLWDFYLAYCQAAFETGNTSVVQFTLERPVRS